MAKLLKAVSSRRITLENVGPVPRPVDIDQSQTGFAALRTLRIYQFAPPAVIEGHAEEDEVFVVVLSGTVRLVIRSDNWSNSQLEFGLSAAGVSADVACAAYLPPHAAYVLTPCGDADIAYVRATAGAARSPAILSSKPHWSDKGVCMLLEDAAHAERLHLQLLSIDAREGAVAVAPISPATAGREALLHVRTQPARNAADIETSTAAPVPLDSWDTLSFAPGETATLQVAAGASATCLLVAAK